METVHRTPLDQAISESGETAAAIGHRAKVSESRISRYRNGLIPPKKARRDIARALKMKPEELWPTA